VLKAQELREVARQSVAQAQEHRRLAQVNVEAGTAAPFDVVRADVEVANAEEGRLQAENGVELAKAALNTALGRDPNTPVEVVPVQREVAPAPEPEPILKEALASRPELAGLEQNVAIAQEGAKIARGGRQPNVILDANYNQQTATAFSEDFSWNASVVVSMPLWDGGLARAQEAESKQQVKQLRQTYEQVRQGIALEVKQSLLSIEEARQRIATAETAVTQAEESLRIARVRYEAGVSPNVELTDAETALTLARTNRVNATYDYALALARLDKARGAYAGEE
jgi:outer membrane protein TolC